MLEGVLYVRVLLATATGLEGRDRRTITGRKDGSVYLLENVARPFKGHQP